MRGNPGGARKTPDESLALRKASIRRAGLAALTLLLTPFLALLAAILILINLTDRRTRSGGTTSPPTDRPPSGAATIVVLNWNGKDLLAEGLPSVIGAVQQDGRPHEILVVDNGSSDGSFEYVRAQFPQVRVLLLPGNLGFAGGNNAGVRAASHDIVVLLNNDMIVDAGFLRPLLDSFGPDTFAVASQIRHQDPSATRQETGRTAAVFRRGMIDYTHRDVDEGSMSRPSYPVFWAGGGSSAFNRERFLALGGFQEIFAPAYVEDADLSYRAWKAGWDVLFAPRSVVFHKHRATTSRRFTGSELRTLVQRNQFIFIWKNIRSWRLVLAHCAFLPWNCYRLARDSGLKSWRSLLQAVFRIGEIRRCRQREQDYGARSDNEVFGLLSNPARYFASARRARTIHSQTGRTPRHVLWMSAYLPYLGRHAGAGRLYQLLKRISVRYPVTLLTFVEDEEERRFIPDLESICEQVIALPRTPPWRWQLFPYEPFSEYVTPAMGHAFQKCIENREFSLIQLEYTQMGCYAQKALGIPTLLTKHEVDFAACARRARMESNPLSKLRWFYNYLQVLDREIALLRRVDAAICVTEPDKKELMKFCTLVPIHVINTGVDIAYFRPLAAHPSGARMVFVGAFRHRPNVDAMHFFCRKVLPLVRAAVPSAELSIVGSEPPASFRALAGSPGVRVTGSVPDIRPLMAEASVYVVPLRLGVGIRGKILEAWSMAIPVVATNVACAGLRVRDGENVMIADEAGEFAARIITLLKDSALRQRMGREGRKTAEQFYGWDAIASQLEALYQTYMVS